MTLESTQTSVAYVGDGKTTYYDIPFRVLERTHLAVTVLTAAGSPHPVWEDTDYQIVTARRDPAETIQTIVGVSFRSPLASGWRLDLRREVPLTQDIVFHNQGPNSPGVTEESLDKLTMICQQLLADIGRAGSALEDRMDLLAAAKADSVHAARHRTGGADPLTPGAIGAMPEAPATPGVRYLVRGGQWVEAREGFVPDGGLAGDLLVNAAPGVGEWRSPAAAAELLPLASADAAGLLSREDKAKLDGAGMTYGTVSLRIAAGGSDATGDGSDGNPFATFAGLWNHVTAHYRGFIAKLHVYYLDGTHNHNITLPAAGGLPKIDTLVIQSLGLSNNTPRAAINLTAPVTLTGIASHISLNYLKLNMAEGVGGHLVTATDIAIKQVNLTSTWFHRATAGYALNIISVGNVTLSGHLEFSGHYTTAMMLGTQVNLTVNPTTLGLRNGSVASYFLYTHAYCSTYIIGQSGLAPVYENFSLNRFAALQIGSRLLFRSGASIELWSNGKTSFVDATSSMGVVS